MGTAITSNSSTWGLVTSTLQHIYKPNHKAEGTKYQKNATVNSLAPYGVRPNVVPNVSIAELQTQEREERADVTELWFPMPLKRQALPYTNIYKHTNRKMREKNAGREFHTSNSNFFLRNYSSHVTQRVNFCSSIVVAKAWFFGPENRTRKNSSQHTTPKHSKSCEM